MSRSLVIGHWSLVIALCLPAAAQAPAPAAGAPADAAAALAEAEATQREITMMEMIRALQITPSQAQAIAGVMEQIQDIEGRLAGAQQDAYRGARPAIESYLGLVVDARPVTPDIAVAAERAYQAGAATVQRNEAAIQDLIASVLTQVLDRGQVDGLEFPEERLAKGFEAQRALSGGGVGIDTVMGEISQARQMSADQYATQADTVSQQIAARVVGPQSPNLRLVARVVRSFVDEARGQSEAAFEASRPVFQARVAQSLGLTNGGMPGGSDQSSIKPDIVAAEGFVAFLRDPRGLDLLRRFLAAQASGEGRGASGEGEAQGE